jgi:hypothetical protein
VRELSQRSRASDLLAEAKVLAYLESAPHLRQPEHAASVASYRAHLLEISPLIENDVEIRVLTEAFYFCAARARHVIRSIAGLRQFEAPGVRDVRNKLLEHPEKPDSTIVENGFSFGFGCGPVIKGVRRADKVEIFPDRGMYVNAQEFASNLEQKLISLIAKTTASH